MERKIIWLIAASTVLMGILLWSKRDAEKPTPRFSPTVDIQSACVVQREHWCSLALSQSSSEQDWYRCRVEYTPRCVACLVAVEYARKHGTRYDTRPTECAGLARWKNKHR